MSKKICYYEVLGGLDRKCEASEIKSAYRKLALKLHPDKAQHNGYTAEEATEKFQVIQEAYSVLSDAQERAWYDSHREQILHGDDQDPFKSKINLFQYFSTSCFDGFTDKATGFFSVYSDLFSSIDREEEEWEDAEDDHVPKPTFGSSGSDWSSVSSFYKHWSDFCSRKAFGHADKWNPREADSRQVRRAMEQENKKERQAAKQKFNSEVRALVKYVQKRDPRVIARTKQQARESAEKAQREAAEKERKKKSVEEERKQRREAQRLEEEQRWQEAKEARRQRGEASEEEDEGESEEEVLEYQCLPCRKSFKSEKAMDQHTKSKKHLQLVAKLRQQLEREVEKEVASKAAKKSKAGAKGKARKPSDDSDESDSSDSSGSASSSSSSSSSSGADTHPKAGRGGCGKKLFDPPPRKDTKGSDDEESNEEDEFLARFAGGGRGRGGNGGAPASSSARGRGAHNGAAASGGGADSSSEEEKQEEEEAVPGAKPDAEGGSKKAKQRAKQKAALLEKSREKEHVQELVKNCKKSLQTKKAGEEECATVDQKNAEASVGSVGTGVAPSSGGGVKARTTKDKNKGGGGAASVESVCSICEETFPSRTQLFQHIKESGHAALKEAPAGSGQSATKGTRNKKR